MNADNIALDAFADLFAEYDMPVDQHPGQRAKAPEPMHIEDCPSCRGRGRFISWGGRDMGDCFKCKGKGKIEYKLSAEQRKAGRDYAKKRKQASLQEKKDAFKEMHPAEYAWLQANAPQNSFARSLLEGFFKYGSLSEKQLAAVQRSLAKVEERKVESVKRVEEAKAVEVLSIVEAMERARDKGIEFPKLRLGEFVFSRAGDNSANRGGLYVKRGGEYMGKVVNNKFVRSFGCAEEVEAEILDVCAKPMEAALAYGQRTGKCSCCGRKLTKKESIDRAIGPICAEQYGW